MRVLATSTPLVAGDYATAQERAEVVLDVNPGWTSITLSDAGSGQVLFAVGRSASGAAADGDPFAEPPPGGSVGGVERLGPNCPCVELEMSVLLQPQHVLRVTLNPAIFQGIVMRRLPEGAVAAIVDRQGLFAARSLDYADRVGTPATVYVREAAAKGGEGLYEGRTYEGLVNLTAYAVSEMTGWSAHVAIDHALVAEPRARASAIMLGGSIIALALGALMVAYALADLAQRRREEAQLLELQKVEAIGRFTGTVVHDFKNLLAVMQAGMNQIFRETGEPKTRERVEMVRAAIGRGTRLTNQLLSFSRGDGGEVCDVDLGDLIAGVEDLIRKTVGGGVVLDIRIAPEAREVRANADQIELALLNLAGNARDAMGGEGRLTITTERDGDMIALRVGDTGSGLSPEVQEQLFRPFFTTKDPGKGTGLGLAQVEGAVRNAGGTIDAGNLSEGGAEFILRLHRAGSAAPEAVASQVADA
jgi:signal transduction histidine kinase